MHRGGIDINPTGTSPGAKTWTHMVMLANQTTNLTAGNIILFDTEKAGSGIANDGAGTITLSAGKTYRIDLDVGASFSAIGGDIGVDIYDNTNAVSIVSRAYVVPPTFPSNITRGPGRTTGIVTVGGADIDITARITISTSVTQVYNETSGTRLIIQEV